MLLPQVQNYWGEFTPQGIVNLLWALAKLVERKALTPEQASEGVTALLPQVQNYWSKFTPKGIVNLLWALAKLVERKALTPEQASEAVTALLLQVQNHWGKFTPQGITNLLWVLATFGDWVRLDTISNILGMVDIDEFEYLPDQEMALWALTVFLAKGLDLATVKSSMIKLHRALKNEEKKGSSESRVTTLRLSGVWLEESPQGLLVPDYKNNVSKPHEKQRRILKEKFPGRTLKTEAIVDGLPPVDLLFSREKVVIEIQGSHHYLDKEKQIRTGRTLLKISTYQKLGYKVIEVLASDVEKRETQEMLQKELSMHFSKTKDGTEDNACDSSNYDTAEEGEENKEDEEDEVWFSAEDQEP